MRVKFKEKIIKPTTATSYSIEKSTFDPKTMVQIRFISSLDHGIDFVQKIIDPYQPINKETPK